MTKLKLFETFINMNSGVRSIVKVPNYLRKIYNSEYDTLVALNPRDLKSPSKKYLSNSDILAAAEYAGAEIHTVSMHRAIKTYKYDTVLKKHTVFVFDVGGEFNFSIFITPHGSFMKPYVIMRDSDLKPMQLVADSIVYYLYEKYLDRI